MGIACGSQVVLCDYPVHLDTYAGCSHGCKYCFARTKQDIANVRPDNCYKSVEAFVSGKRGKDLAWCRDGFPLHWGGLSDPFQPAEKRYRTSLRVLEVLARSGYPFIVSTKGKLITEEPYLSLIGRCNCVVQVSMLCSSYDKLEPGAPSFEGRLEMLRALKGNCKRLVVRAQPYMTEIHDELMENIPKMAEAGAEALTVEGMKFKKKKPGLVKVEGDWCYDEGELRPRYEQLKSACHGAGMRFLCAENRLRPMGDDMACCGCGDVPGFEGNHFHAVRMMNGERPEPTERMKEAGSGACFKSLYQQPGVYAKVSQASFVRNMLEYASKRV